MKGTPRIGSPKGAALGLRLGYSLSERLGPCLPGSRTLRGHQPLVGISDVSRPHLSLVAISNIWAGRKKAMKHFCASITIVSRISRQRVKDQPKMVMRSPEPQTAA